jgi:hypothetical protein
MDALTLERGELDVWDVLDEEDDGVGAADVELEAGSLPFELVDFRLFFLDDDDVLYGDVAVRDCLVANGTDESSKCSNTVSKKK